MRCLKQLPGMLCINMKRPTQKYCSATACLQGLLSQGCELLFFFQKIILHATYPDRKYLAVSFYFNLVFKRGSLNILFNKKI